MSSRQRTAPLMRAGVQKDEGRATYGVVVGDQGRKLRLLKECRGEISVCSQLRSPFFFARYTRSQQFEYISRTLTVPYRGRVAVDRAHRGIRVEAR